ncbi:MAG: 50S ribosomal protein L11 methyltransferase [Desulfobacteraceae bacterium]|nr:50S ribosomal protein L11 methyltransferase [Desulfobacteraceae bacterium]
MTKTWKQIDITCSGVASDLLADELAEVFGTSVEYTDRGIRVYLDSARFPETSEKLLEKVRSISLSLPEEPEPECFFSEIADEDWSETWKAHFKPLRVGGRFLITPTWERVEPRPDDLVIRIDPGRAFGTGHHETTRLCLDRLERVAAQGPAPETLLDVGTGSGILAIGAALLGFRKITGIDNDPEAIEVALENIALNNFSDSVTAFCATPDEIAADFDVVVSNIQSLPLIRMSETLAARVKPGGRLILSGILTVQAEGVRAAYEEKGLRPAGTQTDGEWILMAFEKPGGGS